VEKDRQPHAALPEDERRCEGGAGFKEATAAEAFRILEGLGPEWEVLEEDNREVADLLLTCTAGSVKYVG
jgi:hypothetical protein